MVEVNESKARSKPTFSSVAAGKREEKKETKERKSYAQTLKQNNGYARFFYTEYIDQMLDKVLKLLCHFLI